MFCSQCSILLQIGETDSTMLLNIEQTAAISMEQWQEGIVIKQEPTEDQLPIISAQTLSMEQWESGNFTETKSYVNLFLIFFTYKYYICLFFHVCPFFR